LENGATKKQAAAEGGITEETFYKWMKEKPDFSEAVVRAKSKFAQKSLPLISKGPAALLKWLMLTNRDDPELQPLPEKMSVEADGVLLKMVVIGADADTTPGDLPPQDANPSLEE
jgi:transposase-like protein